jgi:predicted deacylase
MPASIIAAVAVPTLALAQDGRATFSVGTAVAQRGQRALGTLAVPPGVDAGYDMPVAVIHGSRPGPVLAVVAGSHGSEYASIVAVEQLMTDIEPADLAGTLILLPIVNVPSFEQIVPHVNPVDGKNMNRFYPGNPNGTQTERAASVITRSVVEPCDHLIDLHGGDLDENLRPYAYWTVTGDEKQDTVSRGMAEAFGLSYIIVSTDRPKDPNTSRFLENTATTRGKPSITAEAGRSGPVDSSEVAMLVRGVRNVMAQLKMTARAAAPISRPIWIERVLTVAAEQNGIFHPGVDRDRQVTAGMKLGVVTDYLNRPLQEIAAPEAGVILFIRAVPSLRKGDTIASIGVIKKGG